MKFCYVCSRAGCRVVAHSFATNAAESATNKVIHATNGATNAPVVLRTLNRRDREDYNAYQREYMKVYRAVKSGRAEWLRG